MATERFYTLPTVEEMTNASENVSTHTAEQLLEFSGKYTNTPEKRLQLLNFLFHQVDVYGIETWSDLRWSMIVDRVNALSTEVNHKTGRLARR